MDIKNNIKRSGIWLYALFSIIYIVILYFVLTITALVVVLQFFIVLITAERNPNLVRFGEILTEYIHDILNYILFLKKDKPFPFGDSVSENDTTSASNKLD